MSVGVRFVRFGWSKVELDVPETWSLAAADVKGDKGYFRLEDEAVPRLEVSWKYIPFHKAKGVEELFEKYKVEVERRVRKAAKKTRELKLRTLLKEHVRVLDHEAVLWISRLAGGVNASLIWYCDAVEKAFTANFAFKASERHLVSPIVKRALESLKCHFPEGYKVLWSLYAGPIKVPEYYNLRAVRLSVKFSFIVFKHRDKDLYQAVCYSGPLAYTLSEYGGSVRKWLEKRVFKEVVERIIRYGKPKNIATVKGAVYFSGKWGGLLSKKRELWGVAWASEDRNRAFALMTAGYSPWIEEGKSELKDLLAQLGFS